MRLASFIRTASAVVVVLVLSAPQRMAGQQTKPVEVRMIEKIAMAQQSYVATIRHLLHAAPETRWETTKTRALINEEITRIVDQSFLKDQTTIRQLKGGIVADLAIQNKPIIMLRADLDALPVTEATGLSFSSTIPGKMHACGHDTHAAMLLGAMNAIYTSAMPLPVHSLRFVFQDAEENPGTKPNPFSGGEILVKEGVLEGVSEVYGLHIWNSPERGTPGVFYSRPGGFFANSGRMRFVVESSGGHVAKPYSGINALRVTHAIQSRLDTFIARHFPPTEPATLEPVILNSGTASNTMPAKAELWYGFRNVLTRQEHQTMMEKAANEVRLVAESFGAKLTEKELIGGHPALINDAESYKKVSKLLADAGQIVEEHPVVLGGEDFAHYLYEKPGSFWFLGAYTPGSGDHHSPTFNPDETELWRGVLFWLTLATK